MLPGQGNRRAPSIADAVVDADAIAVAGAKQSQPPRQIRIRQLRLDGSHPLYALCQHAAAMRLH